MLLRAASCGFSFAGCAQEFAQSLADNHFFPGLNRHGNEFDVIDPLPFFSRGLRFLYSLANGGAEAWIVRAQQLPDVVARAHLADADPVSGHPRSPLPRKYQTGVTDSV